ncbi:MAG TPA: site-2 protease family protein [Thermoanaerobaculia bacterium]|nr:site-2 protease family protein [Thermoanaerobaculia bacterium]
MKGSFRLVRLAGVDIKLHFTFPLILVLGAVQWASPHGLAGAVFGALLMLALFLCVALHELGHAVTAQRLGIPVREIVLLPIGGVALLSRNPRRPAYELLIAAAGPLVNVILAVALFFAIGLRGGLSLAGDALLQPGAAPSLETALSWLLVANVSLVLFNLIPAFPMDGGRMLRAVLAMGMGFTRATRVATVVGQILAMVLGIYAILAGQMMLALIAVFVFLGAGGERAAEEARGLLSTLRLGDAYNKHALLLQPADRVSRVIDYLLTSYQPDFAVIHGGRLLGVVTRDAVFQSLVSGEGDGYVTGIMQRDLLQLSSAMTLADAQERMGAEGRRVAAVVDGERYLGLVNADDIREALQIAVYLRMAEERQGRAPLPHEPLV